jgi:cyclic-di-AMP phosphodiesterase PgpH
VGFWDTFKRWRLAQQGLSSGKKRRVYEVGQSFWERFDHSVLVHWLMCLSFVVGVSWLSCDASAETFFNGNRFQAVIASSALSLMVILIMRLNHDLIMGKNRLVALLLGGFLLHLLLLKLVAVLVDSISIREQYKLLLIPFALTPMIHAVLLGRRAGMFSAVIVSIFGVLMMRSTDVVIYLIISLVCGVAVVMLTHGIRKRLQLLRAGLVTGAIALVLAILFGEIIDFSTIGSQMKLVEAGQGCIVAFSVGFVTAMVISGLLPLLEGLFAVTTDISWLELCDLNHPLLKRLQLEAPGTFHHSLVVASLAESAAESIGANAVLTRACAYFHDIGKLQKPDYFIENQADGAENPHDFLTPTMSALVIIAHTKDGVDLALKHKLNPLMIDAIQEHHGDSLVQYFYRKAQEKKLTENDKVLKGLENMEDLPQIDEKNFRYSGPKPRSKESGILSLADAVESASRTLKKPNPAKIQGLVDDIVRSRLVDSQLDDCCLTNCELKQVRISFATTLRSMLHSRISYKTEDLGDRKAIGGKTKQETSSIGKE